MWVYISSQETWQHQQIHSGMVCKMSLVSKFKKDLNLLRAAANDEIYLDHKNPKLYKKLIRYYSKESVTLSGDYFEVYDIIKENLKRDLKLTELNQ